MITTHVIDIPDNFMDGQQVEGLLKDIHDGVSIIVEKKHYEALEAAEKTPRCPCGGELKGVGYYNGDTVFNCDNCQAELVVDQTMWRKALESERVIQWQNSDM